MRPLRISHPAELLGIPISDKQWPTREIPSSPLCPFDGRTCIKPNRVCSVQQNDQIVAICPHRFLESNKVFADVAELHFGSQRDIFTLKEVSSGNKSLGTFDYVLVQHEPLSTKIVDFAVVEFQTVDTTSTGHLNRALGDFSTGKALTGTRYEFGLNWSNVWKRAFIQVLNKGRVLETWGNKAFWIVQDRTYQDLLQRYKLDSVMAKGADGTTVFIVYDLQASGDTISLVKTQVESATISGLIEAFATNTDIPSKEAFVQNLESKLPGPDSFPSRF